MRRTRFLAPSLAAVALVGAGCAMTNSATAQQQLPGQEDVSRVTAGTYTTDPSHSIVRWSVDHFGFNDYFGLFGDAEGTLTIDPDNLSAAQVDVTIPISSLAVVSEGLRDHMFRAGEDGGDPDFFGPNPGMARFVSTAVDVGDDGTSAEITGNLTLNGVTRQITIDAEFDGAGSNPMSGAQTIGFEGETEIMRSQFGIGYAVPMVSDEVELTISVAFEKQ